jgi:hypothetical protein
VVTADAAAVARVPVGTRKYANGREVPYYAENNTTDHRKLPDGWFSSTSGKIKPNQEFFFKDSGEATWENPIDFPNPKLVKKARAASDTVSPPSTPQAATSVDGLPEGWTSAVSKTTGKTYYMGPGGVTQWDKPGVVVAATNGRVGTRKYADGREVPYWDVNDKSRKLSDGWYRSVSELKKKGQPFYFKTTGEATWENPIDNPNPKLASKAKTEPSTPPPSPKP